MSDLWGKLDKEKPFRSMRAEILNVADWMRVAWLDLSPQAAIASADILRRVAAQLMEVVGAEPPAGPTKNLPEEA